MGLYGNLIGFFVSFLNEKAISETNVYTSPYCKNKSFLRKNWCLLAKFSYSFSFNIVK